MASFRTKHVSKSLGLEQPIFRQTQFGWWRYVKMLIWGWAKTCAGPVWAGVKKQLFWCEQKGTRPSTAHPGRTASIGSSLSSWTLFLMIRNSCEHWYMISWFQGTDFFSVWCKLAVRPFIEKNHKIHRKLGYKQHQWCRNEMFAAILAPVYTRVVAPGGGTLQHLLRDQAGKGSCCWSPGVCLAI